jgi:hypothetical protein
VPFLDAIRRKVISFTPRPSCPREWGSGIQHKRLTEPQRPSGHWRWKQEFLRRTKLKLKLNSDRRSVGQSVLVSGYHLEPMTRFLSHLCQLQDSCCEAPSLTRGWVCNLLVQLLLGLARAIPLWSKSRRIQTIFYCLIWDSPNVEGRVPVFISLRNKVAQLYPRALGSLSDASYYSQGYGGGIVTHLHTVLRVLREKLIVLFLFIRNGPHRKRKIPWKAKSGDCLTPWRGPHRPSAWAAHSDDKNLYLISVTYIHTIFVSNRMYNNVWNHFWIIKQPHRSTDRD